MKIILIVFALCDAAPVTKMLVETNKAQFKEDVQLLRRGWYNHVTGGRCKALRIKYRDATPEDEL